MKLLGTVNRKNNNKIITTPTTTIMKYVVVEMRPRDSKSYSGLKLWNGRVGSRCNDNDSDNDHDNERRRKETIGDYVRVVDDSERKGQ